MCSPIPRRDTYWYYTSPIEAGFDLQWITGVPENHFFEHDAIFYRWPKINVQVTSTQILSTTGNVVEQCPIDASDSSRPNISIKVTTRMKRIELGETLSDSNLEFSLPILPDAAAMVKRTPMTLCKEFKRS
jgi:hypothetical protein